MSDTHSELSVDVCNASPWHPAFGQMQKVLKRRDGDIRMAFAYVRKPAVDLLKPFRDRMNRPGSYLIASPKPPTSQEALEELYDMAPNFVYIHRGAQGLKDKEGKPGRNPLMHSKVALSLADNGAAATAWLGSNNLTVFALGGHNAEIAVRMSGPRSNPAIADIETHLRKLFDTAEPWEPEIDDAPVGGQESAKVLVLHLFGDIDQLDRGKRVHVRLPEELLPVIKPGQTQITQPIHIYVHRSKAELLKEVNPANAAETWLGELTGVVRGRADLEQGVDAHFEDNEFEVVWPSEEKHPPELRKNEGAGDGDEPRQIMVLIIARLPTPKQPIPIQYSLVRTPVIAPSVGRSLNRSGIEVNVPKELNRHIRWDSRILELVQRFIHFAGPPAGGKVRITGVDAPEDRESALAPHIPPGYRLEYRARRLQTPRQRYLYFSPQQWYPS